MIVRVGIDGGVRGGAAAICDDNGAVRLLDAIDIPTTGTGAKERVDALALQQWLRQHAPVHAYIERAQSMPRQGSSSGFKYGRAVGAIEACCEIPLTIIEPTAWKTFHHLHGKDKEGSRQRALQLFPAAHELFARKRDHGRAEAALIALYGATPRHIGDHHQAKSRRRRRHALLRFPKLHERSQISMPRHLAPSQTDEWRTPENYFRALGLVFDLDPCWPLDGPCFVPARKHYTLRDNGLLLPWLGLVWLNPPFGGRRGHLVWLKKFFAPPGGGVCLVNSLTSARPCRP
jgi:crossover junction endodeoxyribonuclease RuvC